MKRRKFLNFLGVLPVVLPATKLVSNEVEEKTDLNLHKTIVVNGSGNFPNATNLVLTSDGKGNPYWTPIQK